MAMDYGLEIIPVLNKIDLPAADPVRVGKEIEKLLGIPADQIIKISGKTGQNVDLVLDEVLAKIPNPIPDI
jgi:GTP-binding protein LepA